MNKKNIELIVVFVFFSAMIYVLYIVFAPKAVINNSSSPANAALAAPIERGLDFSQLNSHGLKFDIVNLPKVGNDEIGVPEENLIGLPTSTAISKQ